MMKQKNMRKLNKYVEKDDLSKLKHYIRKHDVKIELVLFDNADTMLHRASYYGAECVLRYCLKRNLDPLVINEQRELPIHLACRYAVKGNKYAYTDIILPLIKACPKSLDFPDKVGITPRHLLDGIKSDLHDQLNEGTTSSSSDEEAGDERATTPSGWNEKLADAFEDEQQESWERYNPTDDYHKEQMSESWDEWAEKLNQQHRQKHYAHFHVPSNARKRRSAEGDTKRPQISEEKKRKFEENLKRQGKLEQERLRLERDVSMKKLRDLHEEHAKEIFDNKESKKKLGFRSIPWPHPLGKGVDDMEEFLFGGIDKCSDKYKKCVRAQQVRWHPDRFLQKVGDKLKDEDRERILDKVKQISQLLNVLLKDST